MAALRLSLLHVFALGIYCLGMVSMFVSSACYNMMHAHRWREYLRRADHSAIFVMIAGSYTPFTLLKIGGLAGYGLLVAVWVIAIAGVILKLCFPRRFERLAVALYLAQGWAIVVAFNPLLASISARARSGRACIFTIWLPLTQKIINHQSSNVHPPMSSLSSSGLNGGSSLWSMAWQFGQTGIRSIIGSTL